VSTEEDEKEKEVCHSNKFVQERRERRKNQNGGERKKRGVKQTRVRGRKTGGTSAHCFEKAKIRGNGVKSSEARTEMRGEKSRRLHKKAMFWDPKLGRGEKPSLKQKTEK